MTSDQRKKLALLMLNMFIAVGSFGIIIPIIPAYLKEIGQGGTAAGLIIAIFAFAQLIQYGCFTYHVLSAESAVHS